MGIKNFVKKVAGKAADKVSKVSALSPEQIAQINKEREDYLFKNQPLMIQKLWSLQPDY